MAELEHNNHDVRQRCQQAYKDELQISEQEQQKRRSHRNSIRNLNGFEKSVAATHNSRCQLYSNTEYYTLNPKLYNVPDTRLVKSTGRNSDDGIGLGHYSRRAATK